MCVYVYIYIYICMFIRREIGQRREKGVFIRQSEGREGPRREKGERDWSWRDVTKRGGEKLLAKRRWKGVTESSLGRTK